MFKGAAASEWHLCTATLQKHPTPDGSAVRDYVHVTDLVEAHVLAMDHLANPPGQAGWLACMHELTSF
jgi:nucleoside-diphosphate-sugar epimerase